MKTSKSERARIINDMSAYMREHGEHCTRDTLLLQFSPVEVDTYANDARSAANVASSRAA